MRVLVISDVTGYMQGGVPAETVHLVRGLASRGHAVALAGDIVPQGAEAARHLPISVPGDHRLAQQVQHALQAFSPDVVHVMAMSSRGIVRIAPVLRATPWIMTCHALPPQERKLRWFHASEPLHYA